MLQFKRDQKLKVIRGPLKNVVVRFGKVHPYAENMCYVYVSVPHKKQDEMIVLSLAQLEEI